jgi:uncharacterized membrane protein YhaH (DUF805 family)
MQYYFEGFRRYFNFSDRANRPEYWYFSLFSCLAVVACDLLDVLVFHRAWPLTELYDLTAFIPAFALAFRRLHDTGRTGWVLLWLLLPIIGAVILFVFLLERGEPTANAYGAPRADWRPAQ